MSDTKASIPGSNTILLGPHGGGKTWALRTLVDAGITPFILFTEQGMRSIADVPCPDLHYKYVRPSNPSWSILIDNAKRINSMSVKSLQTLDSGSRKDYTQFIDVLTSMNDFVCDRCGQHFGDVQQWGTDRAICIDGLSGLSTMSIDLQAGGKPIKTQPDWGVAMDNLERFLLAMTSTTNCHFVLLAHLGREKDEISGGVKLMVSTLGNKLAPKIPYNFDDVVLCEYKGDKFNWATVGSNIDLKWRNLTAGTDLPQSFVPLIESWKSAGGVIEVTELT